ncbi:hypothetical protein D3C77_401400 [compost metagenome]
MPSNNAYVAVRNVGVVPLRIGLTPAPVDDVDDLIPINDSFRAYRAWDLLLPTRLRGHFEE